MQLTQQFREQTLAVGGEPLASEIDNICFKVRSAWNVQHKPDDTHGAVTADSVASAGGYKERGRAFGIGEWQNVAFNALNFGASAGAWTVVLANQFIYRYLVTGKSMLLQWNIGNTNVTVGGSLFLIVPGGFVASALATGFHAASDAGAARSAALVQINPGGNFVTLFKDLAGNPFGVTAGNNTLTFGSIEFPLQ